MHTPAHTHLHCILCEAPSLDNIHSQTPNPHCTRTLNQTANCKTTSSQSQNQPQWLQRPQNVFVRLRWVLKCTAVCTHTYTDTSRAQIQLFSNQSVIPLIIVNKGGFLHHFFSLSPSSPASLCICQSEGIPFRQRPVSQTSQLYILSADVFCNLASSL